MTEFTNKYHIIKRNGNPVTFPAFVLRIDGNDPHALKALEAYADSVRLENEQLADELMFIVRAGSKKKTYSVNDLLVALNARR